MSKLLILPILLILAISSQISATDKWNTSDKILVSIFTVTTILDWGQTREAATRYDEGYEETNIFLGKKPSKSKIDVYMPVVLIASLVIADILPTNYRTNFLYILSTVEVTAVRHNYAIGLRFNL